MIIWKGYGIISLIILGLSSYLVETLAPEYFSSLEMSNLSKTLFVAAILILPLSVWDLRRYIKERTVRHSVFFIPVFILPLILGGLGFLYINYVSRG